MAGSHHENVRVDSSDSFPAAFGFLLVHVPGLTLLLAVRVTVIVLANLLVLHAIDVAASFFFSFCLHDFPDYELSILPHYEILLSECLLRFVFQSEQ